MREWIDKVTWLWSGRSFGNAIADSMTIPRRVFRRAMEVGGMPEPVVVLAEIRRRGIPVLEARRVIAPIVVAGLFTLLTKFGAEDDFVLAHSKLTHQFPNSVSRAAYTDAFKTVDALVKAS
jgi:hypothetical protein